MKKSYRTWDFALKLDGIYPADLPMRKLSEYMALWALVMGSDARPVFKGLVKGSVVLRASVDETDKVAVAERLSGGGNDPEFEKLMQRFEDTLRRDGLKSAHFLDAGDSVLRMIFPESKTVTPEITMHDTAEIDGVVFRISGKDNTTSIGLLEDGTDRVFSVETTNNELAKRFARNFKGAVLRVRTHGTWTRTLEGRWEPKNLVADDFEELDGTPLHETMTALRRLDSGWSKMEDPIAEWKRIRGIE